MTVNFTDYFRFSKRRVSPPVFKLVFRAVHYCARIDVYYYTYLLNSPKFDEPFSCRIFRFEDILVEPEMAPLERGGEDSNCYD